MKTRIAKIRSEAGLTQQKMADILHTSQGSVANWERGATEPNGSTVDTICNAFSVNRAWLLTGEGEMYKATSADEKLAAWLGEVMAAEPDDVRRRLIKALSEMPPAAWETVEQFAEKMAKEK